MFWLLLIQVYGTEVNLSGCSIYKCATSSHTVPAGDCWVSETNLGTTTYYVAPCDDPTKPTCPLAPSGNTSGTCEPVPPPGQTNVLPGEVCDGQNFLCINTTMCVNLICQGLKEGTECETTDNCAPGLYCDGSKNPSTCQKQLTPSSSTKCTVDGQCVNNYFCNSGKCTPYSSLANGAACDPTDAYQCKSGFCNANDSICYDAPKSINAQPGKCTATTASSSECPSETFTLVTGQKGQLKQDCQCGYNATGQPYCSPNPGDEAPKILAKIWTSWYASSEIRNCNSNARKNTLCQAAWMSTDQFEALQYYTNTVDHMYYYIDLER